MGFSLSFIIMEKTIGDIELPGFEIFKKGKVRDVYDLGDKLLIVATDRISAFDVVMPTASPTRARSSPRSRVLVRSHRPRRPHHLISVETTDLPPASSPTPRPLDGRSMLVRKTKVVPIECVVRGYLAGSGWKEYQTERTVCGIKPARRAPAVRQAARADLHALHQGRGRPRREHLLRAGCGIEGRRDLAGKLRDDSPWPSTERAAPAAAKRGIIIADTKFELGLRRGRRR